MYRKLDIVYQWGKFYTVAKTIRVNQIKNEEGKRIFDLFWTTSDGTNGEILDLGHHEDQELGKVQLVQVDGVNAWTHEGYD